MNEQTSRIARELKNYDDVMEFELQVGAPTEKMEYKIFSLKLDKKNDIFIIQSEIKNIDGMDIRIDKNDFDLILNDYQGFAYHKIVSFLYNAGYDIKE